MRDCFSSKKNEIFNKYKIVVKNKIIQVDI